MYAKSVCSDGDSDLCQCRLHFRDSELGLSRVRRADGWTLARVPVQWSLRNGLANGMGDRWAAPKQKIAVKAAIIWSGR